MPRKGVGKPPPVPTGWAKRLPTPVEMVAGKHKKVLRTLSDVRGYILSDLPEDVRDTRVWRGVTRTLIESAEGDTHTSRVEIALRMARMVTPRSKP